MIATIPVWVTHTACGSLKWRCQCEESHIAKTWTTAIKAAKAHAKRKHRVSAEIVT